MKLKTLKDIFTVKEDLVKCLICGSTAVKMGEVTNQYEVLKAEAVKWVKALQPEISKLNNIQMLKKQIVSEWIIKFFNLTEEDLK